LGTFTATLEVGNLTAVEFASVDALVDTGAYYTMVDSDLLESLGIQPTEQVELHLADGRVVELHLADGRVVEYNMGEARLRLGRAARPTVVVFGPPGVGSLIGAMTLQLFRLVADSVNERLIPMPMLRGRPF
jgi:predicted aspartyl protease